jgi:hypothetical protein
MPVEVLSSLKPLVAWLSLPQMLPLVVTTGWKVDLITRKERPFSQTEFARRQPISILGVSTAVATVEDTVLAKLEWAKAGDSDRQRRDVDAMLGVQHTTIDTAYLRRWADNLGVSEELDAALRAAEKDAPS